MIHVWFYERELGVFDLAAASLQRPRRRDARSTTKRPTTKGRRTGRRTRRRTWTTCHPAPATRPRGTPPRRASAPRMRAIW